MWVLSIVVLIYVASGGLRAVAYVDTVQCILLWLGIVIVGIIALERRRRLGRAEHGDGAARRVPASASWGTTQGVA